VPKMRTQLVAARTVAEALADLATVPDSAAPRPTGHPSRRSPAHARKASSSPSDGPGLPGCAAPARARVWLWVRHARRPRRAGGGARCGGANRRAVRGSDDRDGRRLRGPRRGAGKDCRRRGVAKTARIVALALLGAAAAVAAVAGELHTGAVWGSPLSDLVWTLDATMLLQTIAALVIAVVLGTPGARSAYGATLPPACAAARPRRRSASSVSTTSTGGRRGAARDHEQAAMTRCADTRHVDQLDEWEARRRTRSAGGDDALRGPAAR